jgi:hypothetical protein
MWKITYEGCLLGIFAPANASEGPMNILCVNNNGPACLRNVVTNSE